jgi:deoxyribose-phosphate aldolase
MRVPGCPSSERKLDCFTQVIDWRRLLISTDELARKFDHTDLRQDATEAHIALLCKEAVEYTFFAVCLNPCYVGLAHDLLSDTSVKVCTVVGFPLGANRTRTKLAETEEALRDGAHELDVVMNVGLFKSCKIAEVETELRQIVSAIKSVSANKICKVIVETGLLSPKEIEIACHIVNQSGADFIKTSTGFSKAGGATIEVLETINRHRGKLKVKAAGGIRNLDTALAMLRAGADRLGASQSVSILAELQQAHIGKLKGQVG